MDDRRLCRGKRLDNGDWVEGQPFQNKPKDRTFIATLNEYEKELDLEYQGENAKIIISPTYFFEVDPSTVGQCTGLTDKNGVKVFEGDIVRCHHSKHIYQHDTIMPFDFPEVKKYTREYVVEWNTQQSKAGYRLRNKSIHFSLTGNVILNHGIEVIGNIHDKEGK